MFNSHTEQNMFGNWDQFSDKNFSPVRKRLISVCARLPPPMLCRERERERVSRPYRPGTVRAKDLQDSAERVPWEPRWPWREDFRHPPSGPLHLCPTEASLAPTVSVVHVTRQFGEATLIIFFPVEVIGFETMLLKSSNFKDPHSNHWATGTAPSWWTKGIFKHSTETGAQLLPGFAESLTELLYCVFFV